MCVLCIKSNDIKNFTEGDPNCTQTKLVLDLGRSLWRDLESEIPLCLTPSIGGKRRSNTSRGFRSVDKKDLRSNGTTFLS